MPIIKPRSLSQEIARNEATIKRLKQSAESAKIGFRKLKLRYYKSGDASRQATQAAAAAKAGIKVGTGVGLAVAGAAGALGAAAIINAKRKFNKEIDQSEDTARHNQMMRTIKKMKKKK